MRGQKRTLDPLELERVIAIVSHPKQVLGTDFLCKSKYSIRMAWNSQRLDNFKRVFLKHTLLEPSVVDTSNICPWKLRQDGELKVGDHSKTLSQTYLYLSQGLL